MRRRPTSRSLSASRATPTTPPPRFLSPTPVVLHACSDLGDYPAVLHSQFPRIINRGFQPSVSLVFFLPNHTQLSLAALANHAILPGESLLMRVGASLEPPSGESSLYKGSRNAVDVSVWLGAACNVAALHSDDAQHDTGKQRHASHPLRDRRMRTGDGGDVFVAAALLLLLLLLV